MFSCQREREVALVDPSANRNGHSISNRVHIRPTGEEVCHMLLPQLVGLLHGVVVRVAALALHPILSQLALPGGWAQFCSTSVLFFPLPVYIVFRLRVFSFPLPVYTVFL